MSDLNQADFERLLAELEGRLDATQHGLLHEDLSRDPLLCAHLVRLALDRVLVSELLLEEQESALAMPTCALALEETTPVRRAIPAFTFVSAALAAAAVLIGSTAFMVHVSEQSAPVAAEPRSAAPLTAKVEQPTPVLKATNVAPKIIAIRNGIVTLQEHNRVPVIQMVQAPVALTISATAAR